MPKKHAEMKLAKKRNGRYVVKKRGGGRVNGVDKAKFLQESGVVKVMNPKAKVAAAE